MALLLCMSFGINSLLLTLLYKSLNSNRENRFLFSILALLLLGTAYVIITSTLHANPKIIAQFIDASPALIGPLSFLYIKQSISQENIAKKTVLFHIFPFLLAFVIGFFDTEERSYLSFVLNVLLKVVVSLVYFGFAIYYSKRTKMDASTNSNHTESWLIFIAILGAISYFLYLIFVLLWWFEVPFSNNHLAFYANILVAFFVLTLSYYGLSKTNIFQNWQIQTNPERRHLEVKELLPSTKVDSLYEELVTLMKSEKLFLDETIGIDAVARKLDVHTRYLSFVISKKTNGSFFDFVNHFRIQEFNTQILNPTNRQFTFLSVALDCGFGSKSAFNRAYKKEMGSSPSEFLKSQND